MAYQSGTASNTEGSTKTTATYSVDTSGFGYSVITDDIKADFDFLTIDLPNKLDNVNREIDNAASITNAFYFENGDKVQDISDAKSIINQEISSLKEGLTELHSAFMKDIDEVNLELEYNFGWIIIGEVKGSQRSETVETENKNS